MSKPNSLKEIYADEMKDLWSANDQMTRAVKSMAERAHDPELKRMLEKSVSGITEHRDALKALLAEAGVEVEKEHCQGMEGLVKEALKHAVEDAPENGDLRDVLIVAQYQRMSHYGIAGFGTAGAYANALGLKEHVSKLKAIVSDIYKADEYATKLGEKAEKVAPKEEA
jgi:ferritin-like metal-binding protein YciE